MKEKTFKIIGYMCILVNVMMFIPTGYNLYKSSKQLNEIEELHKQAAQTLHNLRNDY